MSEINFEQLYRSYQPISALVSYVDSDTSEYKKQPFYQMIKEFRFDHYEIKLNSLKNNIGEELYNKLSKKEKLFIVNVSGTINKKGIIKTESFSNFTDIDDDEL
jgi:hypothetical protein